MGARRRRLCHALNHQLSVADEITHGGVLLNESYPQRRGVCPVGHTGSLVAGKRRPPGYRHRVPRWLFTPRWLGLFALLVLVVVLCGGSDGGSGIKRGARWSAPHPQGSWR